MQIEIRIARPDDLDWLLGQLKDFSKFFGTKRSLFGDEEYSRKFLLGLMQEHYLAVADISGVGPVGLIAGVITPHMFNPQIRILAELFWWVDEAYRGTRAGLMLLNSFEAYGKANADWITFCLEEKSPVNDRSLIKRGFHLQERSYLKEIG